MSAQHTGLRVLRRCVVWSRTSFSPYWYVTVVHLRVRISPITCCLAPRALRALKASQHVIGLGQNKNIPAYTLCPPPSFGKCKSSETRPRSNHVFNHNIVIHEIIPCEDCLREQWPKFIRFQAYISQARTPLSCWEVWGVKRTFIPFLPISEIIYRYRKMNYRYR